MKENSILDGIIKTLSFLTRKEKLMLIVATGITILIGILTSLPVLIIGQLGDLVLKGFKASELVSSIVFIAIIFVMKLIFELINKYIIENIDTHSEKRVTDNLLKNILSADMLNVINQKKGTINGQVIRCVNALVEMKVMIFVELLPIIFTTITAIFIALNKNIYIALFMISSVPLSILVSIAQVKLQKPLKKKIVSAREDIDGKINEVLGGIITIRVADTHKIEEEEMDVFTEKRRNVTLRHNIGKAWFRSAHFLIEGMFTIGTVLLCIYFVSIGSISHGDILVYVILFNEIAHPLRELSSIANSLSEKTIMINILWSLYNMKKDKTLSRLSKDEVEKRGKRKIDNDIIINNLSYEFKNPDKKVINDISLHIKEGEHIGIMGYSGSGKTTLAKILLRLVHDYQGDIFIRGKNLLDYRRSELSKTIAYLSHSPYIFYGTIKDNICYGYSGTLPVEKLIEVAKKAEIYDDIMLMEGQFNAHVDENGANLSLGQRQKLGLARLMILRPKIIILDEATSALDNISENIILHNIDTYFPEQTRISIAHRYTALESCDKIFVINKGELLFEGDFHNVNNVENLFEIHKVQNTLSPHAVETIERIKKIRDRKK